MRPHVKFIGPGNDQFIAFTCRFLAWPDVRDCAQSSGCRVEEKRVGLISKRFKLTGNEAQLERFLELCWKRDLPGFRKELTRVAT